MTIKYPLTFAHSFQLVTITGQPMIKMCHSVLSVTEVTLSWTSLSVCIVFISSEAVSLHLHL